MWAVPVPSKNGVMMVKDVAVGLDTIPGGGCMVGIGMTGNVLHYSDGGLLLGRLAPGPATAGQNGFLDTQAAVAVSRDPRDGVIDVFVEDDMYLRLSWYRVSVSDITTVDVKVHKP
jgi:hypothetical protein